VYACVPVLVGRCEVWGKFRADDVNNEVFDPGIGRRSFVWTTTLFLSAPNWLFTIRRTTGLTISRTISSLNWPAMVYRGINVALTCMLGTLSSSFQIPLLIKK
jgi:hypothetical protein